MGRSHKCRLTLSWSGSVKLCSYPGCLRTVPLHYVEVAQDAKADLHKQFEAEEGEYGEVDIGQVLGETVVFHRRHCFHSANVTLFMRTHRLCPEAALNRRVAPDKISISCL